MQALKGFRRATPTEHLKFEEHSEVICYPRGENEEFQNRVQELQKLDIQSLHFSGPTSLTKTSVLGKGCVSVVVEVEMADGGSGALKIRRTDSNRRDMSHEAKMLTTANKIDVGPKLLDYSANFLVMELIRGPTIDVWIKRLRGSGRRSRIRRTVGNLLSQCHALDSIRLDHGELSRATKHAIIGNCEMPELIDFESASLCRRPSNVTAISQYLLIGGAPSGGLRRLLGGLDRYKFIQALKLYKQDSDETRFNEIMRLAKLTK